MVVLMGQKVSKNTNYSIYNRHTLFGHNSAIFGPNGLEFFMVTQETINIFQLFMKNLGFGPHLLEPKKGRCPTDTHMGLGPKNSTIKLTHLVDLLGHLLS